MMRDYEWLLREKYNGVPSPEFEADKARLDAGEPLAYLIGHTPFLNTTTHLDSHPLIPRPETEFWVERAISSIQTNFYRGLTPVKKVVYVLDLCAGSGAIGVAVAKAIPQSHVTFLELDKAHLPTIAKNLADANISCTRYQIFESDLFSSLTQNVNRKDLLISDTLNRKDLFTFDFILTNPPYIDPAVDRAEASVKAHEPHLALYGGEAGMEFIARIIAETPQYLTKGGHLWIEHEPEQTAALEALAKEYGFTAQTHKDQYGVERFSILRPI